MIAGVLAIVGASPSSVDAVRPPTARRSIEAAVQRLETALRSRPFDSLPALTPAPTPDSPRDGAPSKPDELATWFYGLPASDHPGRSDWDQSALQVIDEAGAARGSLEEAGRDLGAARTNRSAGKDSLVDCLEGLRMYMLQQVYFMEAMARVDVAHTMAARPPAQYCFQAMESATDDLDRALRMAEQRPEKKLRLPPAMPAAEIRQLRRKVFSTWESARIHDDPSAIAALSVSSLIADAERIAAADPANRDWIRLHALRGIGG